MLPVLPVIVAVPSSILKVISSACTYPLGTPSSSSWRVYVPSGSSFITVDVLRDVKVIFFASFEIPAPVMPEILSLLNRMSVPPSYLPVTESFAPSIGSPRLFCLLIAMLVGAPSTIVTSAGSLPESVTFAEASIVPSALISKVMSSAFAYLPGSGVVISERVYVPGTRSFIVTAAVPVFHTRALPPDVPVFWNNAPPAVTNWLSVNLMVSFPFMPVSFRLAPERGSPLESFLSTLISVLGTTVP